LTVYFRVIAFSTLFGIGVVMVLTPSTLIGAETPTISDLPATMGNESTADTDLTNNTLPVQNTTAIYSAPPL
jgi:hypothetical protein